MIEHNIAAWDRGVRVLLGSVLLALTVIGPRSMLGLLGIFPLLTGLSGYSPLYRYLGRGTLRWPRD